MSSHKVEVVRIKSIEPHPNADRLELIKVWGYTAIVKKGDFRVGDLAVYIEPDYVVPETEPFAFLGKHRRIKARRLRGVWSQGLLMPIDILNEHRYAGHTFEQMWSPGSNVMELLGIERYVPPADRRRPHGPGGKLGSPDKEKGLPSFGPWVKYDLENLRRHADLIKPGEVVYVTEKIHGKNARFRYAAGRMWCGSRSGWKNWKPEGCTPAQELRFALHALFCAVILRVLGRALGPRLLSALGVKTPNYGPSVWWRVLEQQPWIEELCRRLPGFELHGEVYGDVQDLKYGHGPGELSFAIFDVKRPEGKMLTPPELRVFARAVPEAQMVPYLGTVEIGKFSLARLEEMSRIENTFADKTAEPGFHVGEGVVVATADGRVKLKLVSDLYLERS